MGKHIDMSMLNDSLVMVSSVVKPMFISYVEPERTVSHRYRPVAMRLEY